MIEQLISLNFWYNGCILIEKFIFVEHKNRDMKKFAIISAVVFVFALVLSSCGKENCPAYSKADTNTEVVG